MSHHPLRRKSGRLSQEDNVREPTQIKMVGGVKNIKNVLIGHLHILDSHFASPRRDIDRSVSLKFFICRCAWEAVLKEILESNGNDITCCRKR